MGPINSAAGPRQFVAVIGGARCLPAQARIAQQVGERLANDGFGLVCGGRGGVMEAACRGAKSRGGLTVGILPGSDPAAANRFVDIPIPTGLGEARNALVVNTAVAVIAVAGEYGTLSEIAFALKAGKPLVGIGSWRLTRPDGRPSGFQLVDGADEAVDWVKRAIEK